MDTPTFLKYLGRFKKHTNPTEQNPVLVLLDNHVSHVSLQAVIFAKDNYIHLLSLLPHSSQKTQPLDRLLFRHLKAYYESVADTWATPNPGQVLSIYHVAGLLSTAKIYGFIVRKTVDCSEYRSRNNFVLCICTK
nr:unnamed protein product [Callosobruchus analis]